MERLSLRGVEGKRKKKQELKKTTYLTLEEMNRDFPIRNGERYFARIIGIDMRSSATILTLPDGRKVKITGNERIRIGKAVVKSISM